MSNAREHDTSPLTPEQKQRAEALRIAAGILSNRNALSAGALPDNRTPDEAIALADFILTGLLHVPGPPIEAEIEDDPPEPEAGGASEKATECQWPGCHVAATGECGVLSLGHDGTIGLQPVCGTHAGYCLATP